jgi:Bifunctional DNA primase/polymerase, N-terminal
MRITFERLRLLRAGLDGMAQRNRLRRAAVRFAEHGWDVIPGACLHGVRYYCGPGCTTVACHPAFAHGEALSYPAQSSHDPQTVAGWWRVQAHAVLLATGSALDVLEVPAYLGVSRAYGPTRGPVAATATGRYMVLVGRGAALRQELADLPDVVLHGRGSWVPAPPTAAPEGRVRWMVSPQEVGWRIPAAAAVQEELVRALPRLRAARPDRPALRRAA